MFDYYYYYYYLSQQAQSRRQKILKKEQRQIETLIQHLLIASIVSLLCVSRAMSINLSIKSRLFIIGVTYGGYGRYAYLPLFGQGGTVPPTFWACGRKNNSDFPSSSAHVSPYNIKYPGKRLAAGASPQKLRIDLHRCIQKTIHVST